MSCISDILNYTKTPFSKEFWTTSIPNSAQNVVPFTKNFFADWSKASHSISSTLGNFIIGENSDNKQKISFFGNIVDSAAGGYRKEENTDPVMTQTFPKTSYDVNEFITENVQNIGVRIITPCVIGNNTGPMYTSLFSVIVIQEYLFGKGDNTTSDIPYYVTMSGLGEALVAGVGMITNEMPSFRILSMLNYLNPIAYLMPNFSVTKNLFLILVAHPAIKKTIQEQPLIKTINDYGIYGLTSLSNQIATVATSARALTEKTIVYFIGGVVEVSVNHFAMEKINEQTNKIEKDFIENEKNLAKKCLKHFVVYVAKHLTDNGVVIGKEIAEFKIKVLNFAVKQIADGSVYLTKQGFKATLLTFIVYRSLSSFPFFTGLTFILQGGTKQSTAELCARINTAGFLAIRFFTPWFISTPIQLATIITMTGGPGDSLMESSIRVGAVATAFLITSFFIGGPLTAAVAMIGVNFFLDIRRQELASQWEAETRSNWEKETSSTTDGRKAPCYTKRETTFIEDAASFYQKRNEKMTMFWERVNTRTNGGGEIPSIDGETPKTALRMNKVWSVISQVIEDMYAVRTFIPAAKMKME
jgi:hypothetical protein